jgi:hypothetical protein
MQSDLNGTYLVTRISGDKAKSDVENNIHCY